MSNAQLYLAIGVPLAFQSALILGLFLALRAALTDKFEVVNAKFETVSMQFARMEQSLRRVEEVMDARVKHLEERDRR